MIQTTLWDFIHQKETFFQHVIDDCVSWSKYPGYHIISCAWDDECEWSLYLVKDGDNIW